MSNYLAVDLGAESGRVMVGSLAGDRLALEELHRFPNQPVQLPSGLYWDAFRLFHEIIEGLRAAGQRQLAPAGIGVDTWGVDFGLTGPGGGLIDCPRHYRDPRTNGVPEQLFARVPRSEVFDYTGIQIMAINSLYQLYSMSLAGSPALAGAERLLFMPDLLNYWLCGVQRAEVTIASTSQFYNPRTRRFETELFERLGMPAKILPDLIEPGEQLGSLLPHLAHETGLGAVPVYVTAAHDTASAVAAVPAEGSEWCYISSGTWSLMGVELPHPVIDERTYNLNFTNEAGFGGRTRLLKNIAGLWLLQECRRAWMAQGETFTYQQLAAMAEESGPAAGVIDPDDFLQPGDMPARIDEWCRAHGIQPPRTKGETCRLILESLAHRYHQVLQGLESIAGHKINTIHIVGGGSRNRLLNQLVASVTGRKVVAGPVEATAAGNVLVQAIGAGEVADLEQARRIVRESFEIETFEPAR
ncbi:MAG TPA: rhamnulokinase family protein [Candidatus Sulfopaludibacter sp.]|jgi:rhamnulokinase|nr:rhamnulokinase family protein [Candidatus Sulfopaludibacter sp.]